MQLYLCFFTAIPVFFFFSELELDKENIIHFRGCVDTSVYAMNELPKKFWKTNSIISLYDGSIEGLCFWISIY